MNAFEHVVASLLQHQGYWVRPSYKVVLTKEEKVAINKPSAPRWELDLVAFKGKTNDVLVVECKSYLDSRGVRSTSFDGSNKRLAARFKLFTDPPLRDVVLRRLAAQLTASGACAPEPSITLCLAAGHIASPADRKWLHSHFKERGWRLWDEAWIGSQLQHLAEGGYENDVASIVAKLILHNQAS